MDAKTLEMRHGRMCMTQETADFLVPFLEMEGDHVEIGTAWGGSAILAAMVKKRKGVVYAIDPITENGFYGSDVDEFSGERLTVAKLHENFEANEVAVVHVDKPSHPFPLPDHRFVTALVDGDHSMEGTWRDFESLQHRVDGFIMFHDVYDVAWPGVTWAWERVCRVDGWIPYMLGHNVGVLANRTWVERVFKKWDVRR